MPFPNQGNTRHIDVRPTEVSWDAVPEIVQATIKREKEGRPGWARTAITMIYGTYRLQLVSPDRKHAVSMQLDYKTGSGRIHEFEVKN